MTTMPDGEYAARADKLRAAAAAEDFDAVLAFSNAKVQANVLWLTGYYLRFVGWQNVVGTEYAMFGSCAALIPTDGGDGMLRSDQTWDLARLEELVDLPDLGCTTKLGEEIGEVIAQRGYKRVAVNNWFLFPAAYYFGLKSKAPDVELVPSTIISQVRRVKSPYEIEMMRQVEAIADAATIAGMDAVAPGVSEYEVALICESTMRELGDINTAGTSLIGAGPNAANGVPAPSREKKIERGEWVLFDVLPRLNGYCGDIARMRLAGDLADLDPKLKHYYDVTYQMNREVVAAIKPGVSAKSLNDLCDEIARDGGVLEYKSPLLGHAIGLDVHDIPDYYGDTSPLQVGEVLTMEPCLGVPGVCGTRIEDVVVVTENGCDVLTNAPRGLTAEG